MYSLNYMNFKNVLASYASFMDLIQYTHTLIYTGMCTLFMITDGDTIFLLNHTDSVIILF